MKTLTNEFIDEYRPYVEYKTFQRTYLYKDREDVIQHVIMYLLKMFPKRFKYSDWDFVVRSAVRRKIMDYSEKFNRENSRLKYESEVCGKSNVNGDEISLFEYLGVGKRDDDEKLEVIDWVRNFHNKICDNNSKLYNIYNEWDREFFEILIELYIYGNDTSYDEIMECMGLLPDSKSKFIMKLNLLRKKIDTTLEEGSIEPIHKKT